MYYFDLVCTHVLPICVYVHCTHAWCPQRPEEDTVMDSSELRTKPRSPAETASGCSSL